MAFTAFNFVRGKQVFAAAIVAAMGLFASPAWATCTGTTLITCDSTQVEAYKGNTFQSSYSSNGFINGVGDVLQQSAHPFDTDKLVASLTEHRGTVTLELKYYTSFNGNDQGAYYADVFLSSKTSTPNAFEYGIALGNQSANGGKSTTGFYNVTSSTTETSREIWSGKTGTYGGKFKGTDGGWYDSPVVVDAAATKNTKFTAYVTEPATNVDPGYGYLVDVKLVGSYTDFNALFSGGLSIFWGTADCSNDAIQALLDFTPVHVPEPVTLSLFSAGVVGAAVVRRRRKSKAA
ncbi:MAG: PEP-CTERM sorting domain-containing protein [Alphaproteobacteria bacterium]|nr:PEP-CTERM sorting domain-containing protein [Alphaproteobacteria bacterium]